MKSAWTKILALMCAVLMVLSLAACGSDGGSSNGGNETVVPATEAAPTIVGDWKYEGGDYIYHFKEDGTGTYDISGSTMNFTYTAEDGKLTITYDGSSPMELQYSIDGDTLNVKDSFGKDTIYKRQ